MAVKAGRLDHRLNLQTQAHVQDDYGAFTTSWTTQATVWGAIEGLKGQEFFLADQMNSQTTSRIVIRWSEDWSEIDDTWRIVDVDTGRKYDVLSVIEPEGVNPRRTMFEIMVRRGKTDDES